MQVPKQVSKPLYFDYHATTPIDERVLQAILPYLQERFGNPSNKMHAYGWEADAGVESARTQVAELIGAQSDEIIFTSGATESINLAVLGTFFHFLKKGEKAHLITCNAEHKAGLQVVKKAQEWGADITILPVDSHGSVSVEQVLAALQPHTKIVSLIHANNEIGTIIPVEVLGPKLKEKGVLLHLDATQSIGRVHIDVEKHGIDLLSFSGHKIYAPKGVGALYVRKKNPRVRLEPLTVGSSQEKGLRPGTLNVAGIVGIGKACEILQQEWQTETARLQTLRNEMAALILRHIPGVQVNGHPTLRLAHNLSLTFNQLGSVSILQASEGIAASMGSACASGSGEPSHVLKAIGLSDTQARSTLRLSLGRQTTQAEVYRAVEILARGMGQSIEISAPSVLG